MVRFQLDGLTLEQTLVEYAVDLESLTSLSFIHANAREPSDISIKSG